MILLGHSWTAEEEGLHEVFKGTNGPTRNTSPGLWPDYIKFKTSLHMETRSRVDFFGDISIGNDRRYIVNVKLNKIIRRNYTMPKHLS
jgi:hypothetical protein